HYGFSSVTPWIQFSQHKNLKTVEDVLNEDNSIFTWYQKLIQLRHEEDIVAKGVVRWPEDKHDTLLYYIREFNQKKWHIYHNLNENPLQLELEHTCKEIILSNYHRHKVEKTITLKPFECLVIKE